MESEFIFLCPIRKVACKFFRFMSVYGLTDNFRGYGLTDNFRVYVLVSLVLQLMKTRS